MKKVQIDLKGNLEKLTNDKPYSLISKGISRSTIQSIMGGSIPAADKIYEVATALNVSMEELLTGESAEKAPAPPQAPEVIKLIAILEKGKPEDVGYVRGVLDSEYRKVEKDLIELRENKKGA